MLLKTGVPIEVVIPDIVRALSQDRRALVQAPPGAGKTTLIPLALLEEPWLEGRRIIMLEPRRLAARASAMRMASLIGEEAGATVGFRTRFDSRVGPDTKIEVVTEGILTRYLQDDPALEDTACVIFDEFHERSLSADLGLALCIESRAIFRDDLRLLVMSATLDGEEVSALLDGAHVIKSEGRTYPVEGGVPIPRGEEPAAPAPPSENVYRWQKEVYGKDKAYVDDNWSRMPDQTRQQMEDAASRWATGEKKEAPKPKAANRPKAQRGTPTPAALPWRESYMPPPPDNRYIQVAPGQFMSPGGILASATTYLPQNLPELQTPYQAGGPLILPPGIPR